MLQIPDGEESLFPHNRDYDEGICQRGIRAGAATVVVALDGSGDAETVQEGIDMLPSTGGVIYIKEGTYVITAAINVNKNNVAILGAGKSTKITTTANARVFYCTNNYFLIGEIYIYGSAGNQNIGIFVEGGIDGMIRNCWIENCDSGIGLADTFRISVIGCNIFSNEVHGIVLTRTIGGTYEYVEECVITNNIIYSNKGDGISSTGSNNCIITSNVCKNNDVGDTSTYSGISLFSPATNNIISGNRCEDNDNYEIDIGAGCVKNIIIGNICVGTDHQGAINDAGTDTHPNGASGTTNLALDDLNIIA